jgi:diguanylate cyclase (GGDEF)-like protein
VGTSSTNRRLELAVLVALVAFVGFLVVAPGSPDLVSTVDNTLQLAVPLLAAVAAAGVARRQTGRLRRSWVFIALACAAWAAGQATWACYEVVLNLAVPQPSVADLGFLAAIPLLLVGVVTYPAAGLVPIGRLRLVLDGTTIAVGLLFTAHGLFLGTALDLADGWRASDIVAVTYPLADVVVLSVLVPVLLRRQDGPRGPLPLLVSGIVGLTVADAAFAYYTAGGRELGDNPTNAGWVAGFALIALAAGRVGADQHVAAGDIRPVIGGEHLVPAIPVAMAAVTLAALVVTGSSIDPELGMVGAILLAALALRQIAIQFENAELNRDLRRSVDQLRAREEELRHRAFHDPLTGLANRDLFRNRLEHALASRHQHPIAVAFVDLDDFKAVNDALGHDAGDELLRLVAERLRACTRPGDTVARLGGDEFAVLIEEAAVAEALARRIVEAFAVPFAIGPSDIGMEASVGMATGRPGADTAKGLLRDADLAMYAAKAAGKGRVETFRPALREVAAGRLRVLGEGAHRLLVDEAPPLSGLDAAQDA